MRWRWWGEGSSPHTPHRGRVGARIRVFLRLRRPALDPEHVRVGRRRRRSRRRSRCLPNPLLIFRLAPRLALRGVDGLGGFMRQFTCRGAVK